jgi:hypothetical protein
MAEITIRDFIPFSLCERVEDKHLVTAYTPDVFRRQWVPKTKTEVRVWDKDQWTGRKYWPQNLGVLWLKNVGLSLGWPVLNHIARISERLFHILTFQQFANKGSLKERLITCGKDVLKIAATPILVAFLQIAAAWGILHPKGGRKLFASIERLAWEKFGMDAFVFVAREEHRYVAPCFQPDTKYCAITGAIAQRKAAPAVEPPPAALDPEDQRMQAILKIAEDEENWPAPKGGPALYEVERDESEEEVQDDSEEIEALFQRGAEIRANMMRFREQLEAASAEIQQVREELSH